MQTKAFLLPTEVNELALKISAKREYQKRAKAPIKKQLTAWVNSFEIAPFIGNDTADNITQKFYSFKKWAAAQIDAI